MAMQAPKGTEDLIGGKSVAWEQMQETARDVFGRYGYEFMSTPLFESTEVFVRGIGEATDVVGKEMFHVLSNDSFAKVSAGERLDAGHDFSLRPEGTAGVVRAAMEHNLATPDGPVAKLMYAGPMFRAERPQKGRLRQFHQIGAECLGAPEPTADAEMIIMLLRFFEAMGVNMADTRLLINSMGDDACRPAYRDSVRDYIHAHAGELCDECNRRAETNPLRAFDCKNEACHEVMEGAPKISDALCDDCKEHYAAVKRYLDLAGVEYEEDPRLVRGLDYYTRTVFEVQVVEGLGSQNAIGGGGRYDKLMESMGGKHVPGIGFALGYERTLLAMEAAGVELGGGAACDVYVAVVDAAACGDAAFSIVQQLRDAGVRAEQDHQGRSLKSQFKQAGKMGAAKVVIVGPDELAEGKVTIRDMETREEQAVAIDGVAAALA